MLASTDTMESEQHIVSKRTVDIPCPVAEAHKTTSDFESRSGAYRMLCSFVDLLRSRTR